MAMYQMDVTQNAISEIKRVLNLAGLISTVYYETTSWIIFSTPRSNKVIKISNSMALYVGDSWTSTATITNEVPVNNPYGGAWVAGGSAWLIVTPDVVCFTAAHPTNNSYCVFWALCKMDNGDFLILSSCSDNTTSPYSRWMNTTTNEQYTPTFAPIGLMTDSNYYYNTYDMPFKVDGTNIYRPGIVNGAKFLYKAPSLNESAQVFNPDVVVSFRYVKNTQWISFQCSFLIVNGNV